MNIDFSQSAIADLENIKSYYSEQQVAHIGENFVIEIIEHIEKLPDNPEIGRQVPEFNQTSIREFIHPPFRIVYVLQDHNIQIIRIWRSERLMR